MKKLFFFYSLLSLLTIALIESVDANDFKTGADRVRLEKIELEKAYLLNQKLFARSLENSKILKKQMNTHDFKSEMSYYMRPIEKRLTGLSYAVIRFFNRIGNLMGSIFNFSKLINSSEKSNPVINDFKFEKDSSDPLSVIRFSVYYSDPDNDATMLVEEHFLQPIPIYLIRFIHLFGTIKMLMEIGYIR
ncbi:MAG: hypothetical protein K2Q18_01505 [Bdellovibrionales bacterium]|nr:hypothetical protein [Bdellovibrionales bacterium]